MEETIAGPQSTLAALLARHTPGDGIHETGIPRVALIRASRPTEPVHALHQPALCIVAQGRKRVMLADEFYLYGPDNCLVVSVDLPVMGHVIEATPEKPYLCLRLDLDPGQLAALMVEAGDTGARPEARADDEAEGARLGPGLALNPVDGALLDAAVRLVRLLDTPRDIAILAPMCVREMLYRLLSGVHSARLRQIALAERRLQPISRAIDWLKRHYAEPFRIDTIAREAAMSPSALHHHFKTVTAMSPLQYQKQLRLQEARRLMLAQAIDAATAGHSVGYESPSQFSREYRRLFGAPPSRDIARLRTTVALDAGVAGATAAGAGASVETVEA